jgi:peptide/nickel transport system ATP-binding protein
MTGQVLLSVKDLKLYFDVGRGEKLKVVDGISFDLYKGETFGLV